MRRALGQRSTWRRTVLALVVVLSSFVALEARQKTAGPDLGVAMIRVGDNRGPLVAPGQTVTVAVGVNNIHGDSEARSGSLTVTLSPFLKLEQTSPRAGHVEAGTNGTTITWDLGTMAAHASPRIFEVTLSTEAALGATLLMSAAVATTDQDAHKENNSATYTLAVVAPVAQLALASNLDAIPITPDAPFTFTAEVENSGAWAAAPSTLTLVFPQAVAFKSADPAPASNSSDSVTWQLDEIAPGESTKVDITMAVDKARGTAPTSPIEFVLELAGPGLDVAADSNRLEIAKRIVAAGHDVQVQIGVEGADQPGELTIGKDVTYVVFWSNFGNQAAKAATTSLSLPAGLSLVKADPVPGRTANRDASAGTVASWDAAELGVGESRTIRALVHVASVPDTGSLVEAAITASGTDINPANNSARSLRHVSRAGSSMAVAASAKLREYGLNWKWLVSGALVLIVVIGIAWRLLRT